MCKRGGDGSDSDDLMVDFVFVLRFGVFIVPMYGFCFYVIENLYNMTMLCICDDGVTFWHRLAVTYVVDTVLDGPIWCVGES